MNEKPYDVQTMDLEMQKKRILTFSKCLEKTDEEEDETEYEQTGV